MRTAADLAAKLDAKRSGSGWMAKCPAHEDSTPSLSISEGTDGKVLLYCHGGCAFDAVVAALGVEKRELFADAGLTKHIIAEYDYTDAGGAVLYQVVRFFPKEFRQRRPDGLGGWTWNLNGTPRVLYRLPDVLDAVKDGTRVWVVEGERDVETLRAKGLVATTNAGGAGKWRPEYSVALQGADVVIVADKDDPGRKHARDVATALHGVAHKVVIVEAAEGKDVSDHLAAGRKLSELVPVPESTTDADGFIRVGDLVAEPDNPHPWVVHGLIPAGGMALVAGKPKAGKSTLARAIALRVCRGESVLGRDTMAGPVLYLGLEDPREAIKGHFRRMGASANDDLHVYTGKVPEYAQAWLADQLAKRDPVLVGIDTMQFFLGIAEINEYGQVVNALRSILDLFRGKRCAVLIVHHAGKGERVGFDAILGSTGILGTVDTAMLVKRRADDGVRLIASMQRMHAPGGEDMPETVLTLDDHTEPKLAGTRADYDLDKMGDAIVDHLTKQGDWTERADVLAAVEGAAKLKVDAVDRLFRTGKVERQGEGKRGKPYLFRIPFFRSPHTPRTAERNPNNAVSDDAVRSNSVLEISGSATVGPGSQNGIRTPCKGPGHRRVGGVCPICDGPQFLALMDAEAEANKKAAT